MLIAQFGNASRRRLASWRDYYVLTKPGVVRLLVFTAIVGMLLASPGMVPWPVLIFGSLGIGLAAAAGAVVNHVLDQRVDAAMARTKNRPIPSGRIAERDALVFAFVLALLGLAILVVAINPLTALLTFASLIGYAVIYTVYLKRLTPQNIVIGGAAGAAPPVLGWTAVQNDVSGFAMLLFLIIFAWTPPHFWALAVARKADYERANVPMLPVTHGESVTKSFIVGYTIVLVIVSVAPFFLDMTGPLYLCGALTLGAGFLYYTIDLKRSADNQKGMRTFAYSISYLAALFSFLLIDHYVTLYWPA